MKRQTTCRRHLQSSSSRSGPLRNQKFQQQTGRAHRQTKAGMTCMAVQNDREELPSMSRLGKCATVAHTFLSLSMVTRTASRYMSGRGLGQRLPIRSTSWRRIASGSAHSTCAGHLELCFQRKMICRLCGAGQNSLLAIDLVGYRAGLGCAVRTCRFRRHFTRCLC